ncbi:ATP-binding protein [Undibacterium sp. Ji22W]|uniref:ATP-binding protein n=1 Tax=Undibacterium sp. Ji22W TaxID=3413038 RepID=UPI003BF34E26
MMEHPDMQKVHAWSLRKALLTTVLIITASIWVCSGIIVHFEAQNESQELFDQSLAETATLLLTLANHEVEERLAMLHDESVESDIASTNQYLLFQVWSENNKLIYKNKGAPDQAFSRDGAEGFHWIKLNGQTWRTYVLSNKNRHLQIQVGESIDHRQEISSRFTYKLVIFAMLILPLMGGVIWWSINRLFTSLQRYADEMSRRTPNDLRMVSLVDAPAELQSLLVAINQLFARVGNAMEQERRFSANASHELRTPLTAIKTNLQVIQRARNQVEQDEAVAGLIISVDRTTHMLEQLLALSRADPDAAEDPQMNTVDLQVFVRKQTRELFESAAQYQMKLDLRLETAVCKVNLGSLRIAFRNILDNAFRYAKSGGELVICTGVSSQGAYLSIMDKGPGIALELREKVLERFFRLSDSITSGSGLGLSIVQSVVASQHGRLSLGEGIDGRGLSVTIYFDAITD